LTDLQNGIKQNTDFQCEHAEWNGFIHSINIDPHSVQLYSPIQVKYAVHVDYFYLDRAGQIAQNLKRKQIAYWQNLGKLKKPHRFQFLRF